MPKRETDRGWSSTQHQQTLLPVPVTEVSHLYAMIRGDADDVLTRHSVGVLIRVFGGGQTPHESGVDAPTGWRGGGEGGA